MLIMYSEALAHQLYAAADFVAVPSLFEPCGLTQMIAMRYGALPVVRKTGGLADTVFDADEDEERGNGFVFEGADEGACCGALDRAFAAIREGGGERWKRMSVANMESDCSWRASADEYHALYDTIRAA
jgi:starch synthase